MKGFLPLLFCLLFASLWCHGGCQSLLPNSNSYIGFGFNSLIGFPPGQAFSSNPVLSITFDNNNSCTLPLQSGGEATYLIPDGFEGCRELDLTSQTVSVQLYTSADSISQQMFKSQSIGASSEEYDAGMYKGSSQTSIFQQSQASAGYSAYSYMASQVWETGFSNAVSQLPLASQGFLSAVANLPPVFSPTTCSAFQNFFTLYGTHVCLQAVYGGLIQMDTTFSIATFEQYTESQNVQNVQAQFGLKLAKSLNDTQTQQLASLNAQYSSSQSLLGGNSSSSNPQQWEGWLSSVSFDPLPLQVYLVDFGTFISPSYPSQASALSQALPQYLQPEPTWISLPEGPFARWFTLSAPPYPSPASADLLYMFGGAGSETISAFWSYDTSTGVYAQINGASFPQGLQGVAVQPYEAGFYLFGGQTNSGSGFSEEFVDTVYLFVPDGTNAATFTQLRSYTYGFSFMGIALDPSTNFIYIVSGLSWYGKTPIYPNAYSAYYNIITNEYTQINNYPEAVWQHACAFFNGNVYCSGGLIPNSQTGDWFCPLCVIPDTYMYNVTTRQWQTLPVMLFPRSGHTLLVSDGLLYAVGGQTPTGQTNTIEYYSPASNSWQLSSTTLPVGIAQGGITIFQGSLFLIDGIADGAWSGGAYLTSSSCFSS